MSASAARSPAAPPADVRAPLEIRPLDEARTEEWDAFVRRSAGGTFFHLAGWRDPVERVLRHRTHYLVATRGGGIEGVLPLGRVRSRLFGDALISVPFAVYGGALGSEPEVVEALGEAALALGRRLGVGHLDLRYRDPETAPGLVPSSLYVTFRKPLLPETEANLKAIPRKQRAMVRKGMQAGLRSTVDPDTGRFYRLYSESVRNLGTPVLSGRWYAALKATFGQACEVLTIEGPDGAPVSSVLSFYFRDEVLPYYGGGGAPARALKANDFMYWELMRRAVERGCRLFDYGRSKQGAGSFHFKKNWGFEPAPLFYDRRPLAAGEVPDLSPTNPRYERMVRAWRRLPLGASRIIGPPIARCLG